MKNLFKILGTNSRKLFAMALAAVIGLAMTGCPTEDGGGSTDSALNGTWSGSADGDTYTLKLDNGKFEMVEIAKGTYTTSNDSMTIKVSHIWMEDSWYTKSEMAKMLEATGVPASAAESELNEMFATQKGSYGVSSDGTILIITRNGEAEILTKQ